MRGACIMFLAEVLREATAGPLVLGSEPMVEGRLLRACGAATGGRPLARRCRRWAAGESVTVPSSSPDRRGPSLVLTPIP